MTLLNEPTQHTLQFYLTAPYPCSYLNGPTARSLMAAPNELVDSDVYGQLVRQGFRRSGVYTYRPQCLGCEECVPVRLDCTAFQPNRTQQRAWKKNAGLVAIPQDLTYRDEHYDLYRRYQASRHSGGGMDQDDREQYQRFLLSSNIATQLIEFREGDALRMVSVIDVLSDGLSSVYTFYEPDLPQASYGTFNILWQAALCRSLGLPWLYLGYWIAASDKMAYKINFRPLQGLAGNTWQNLPPLQPTSPTQPDNHE
ncbi:MAG: arginyltransferase [Sulfuricella sp.]|nr:arginyltransferase [Sulfuricella sp.]